MMMIACVERFSVELDGWLAVYEARLAAMQ